MNEVRPRFHDPVEPPAEGRAWTVLHLLRWSTQYLEGKGVPGVRTDVELLLADTLGMRRLELYLHHERPLTPEELDHFRPRLLERARRRPVQYILGTAPFRDLELKVDERVLIPRPETEELVEAVLSRVREGGASELVGADIGTGSGAIALALAAEGPFRKMIATDRSPEALALARENAERLGLEARMEFREGDLLEALPDGMQVDVLVSNPPYVAETEHRGLAPEVRDHEPALALLAGADGLALYRRLVLEGGAGLRPGGLLALEVGAGQAARVAEWIRRSPAWDAPVVLRDMAGKDRIVLAERSEVDVSQMEGRTDVEDRRDGEGAGTGTRSDRRVPGAEEGGVGNRRGPGAEHTPQ